jgi:hypothetical protein
MSCFSFGMKKKKSWNPRVTGNKRSMPMKKNHLAATAVCLCLLAATACTARQEQSSPGGTSAPTVSSPQTLASVLPTATFSTGAATPTPVKPSLEQLMDLTGKRDEEWVAALGPGEVIKSENAQQINGRTYRVALWEHTYEMTTTVNELGNVVEVSIWMEEGADYDRALQSISAAMQSNPQKSREGEDQTVSWEKDDLHAELTQSAGTIVFILGQSWQE